MNKPLTERLLMKEEQLKEDYLIQYEHFLNTLPKVQLRKECISGFNRVKRFDMWSSRELDIEAKIGDICYFDYGHVFINEAGYQHFGLIVSIFNYKILVVPMTSNANMIRQAKNMPGNQKSHLYYIGQVPGLNKPSVLFLNDAKFINSSRIISVNAHIKPSSLMFKEILKYLNEGIFGDYMIE